MKAQKNKIHTDNCGRTGAATTASCKLSCDCWCHKKYIDQFTDAELAGMVRRSCYARGATFGSGENDSRFLLVVAVPYGPIDTVHDLRGALEGFAELFKADDWDEREFQVYDHNAGQRFFSASAEELEYAIEEEDDEYDN